MNSIPQFLQKMELDESQIPPVEDWNPDYCGEMDLIIKANGDWLHQGAVIKRDSMRRLFSTIVIREDDDYFLITPVEKVAIQVEWQPFVIIRYEILVSQLKGEQNNQPTYVFYDNCGNQVALRQPQQLIFSSYQGQDLPCINIRRNLYAAFSRSCYYELIEQAEIIEKDQQLIPTIYSAGQAFQLGQVKLD
ncbi:MAG: DUF1285 domain-containing protein [Enterobacterales bacterium]|nr:DUF1285 domain-containing protein [Enterobacterales bacterium]